MGTRTVRIPPPAVLVLALCVAGCSSTQKVSDLATDVREHAVAIDTIVDEVQPIVSQEGAKKLQGIKEHTAKIVADTDSIHHEIPNIKDVEGWFGRNLRLIAAIVVPTVVLFGLWYTGALGFVRGFFGLITPHTRTAAKLAAERIDSNAATPNDREAIAAQRVNPQFNGAFVRQRRKQRPIPSSGS